MIKITKEEVMFEVTEKANDMIQDYFKDKDFSPFVRIFLSEGG